MHTEDLRAFFAIVEAGTLSGAAARLGVPKSTLGRRLARLEDDLDIQLVVRTPRQIQVTSMGQQLHDRGVPLLTNLDELRLDLIDRPSDPSGELKIAAPKDLATATMGPLCAAYLRKHSRVRLSLVASNDTVDLVAEDFDVALRIHVTPLPDSLTMKVRRLGNVAIGLFAAPQYLARHAPLRSPEELNDHTLLSMRALGWGWRLRGPGDVEFSRVTVAASMTSTDHYALRDVAEAGVGVASLPAFLCSSQVARGTLQRVLPQWTLRTATLSLLWPARRNVAPRVRAFVEFAAQHFNDDPLC